MDTQTVSLILQPSGWLSITYITQIFCLLQKIPCAEYLLDLLRSLTTNSHQVANHPFWSVLIDPQTSLKHWLLSLLKPPTRQWSKAASLASRESECWSKVRLWWYIIFYTTHHNLVKDASILLMLHSSWTADRLPNLGDGLKHRIITLDNSWKPLPKKKIQGGHPTTEMLQITITISTVVLFVPRSKSVR